MSSKNPQIYIGGLPPDIREREIRDDFEKFGNIVDVHIKNKFAFVEFDDQNAVKDAIQTYDKKNLYDGNALTVEQARRSGGRASRFERGPRRGSPEGSVGEKRGGPSERDRCFRCQGFGHWARSCPAPRDDAPRGGDRGRRRDFSPRRAALDQDRREGKCFTCGTKGHLARDCPSKRDYRGDKYRDRGGRGRYDDRDHSSEGYGGRRGGRRDDRRDRYYDDYRGGRRGGHSPSYSPRGEHGDKYYEDRRDGERGYAPEGRARKARDYGRAGGSRDNSWSRDRSADRGYGRDEPPRGGDREYSEERKGHEGDAGPAAPKDKNYWPYINSLDELHHELDQEEGVQAHERIPIMVHFTNANSAMCADMSVNLQDLGHLIGKRMLLFTVDTQRNPETAKTYECDQEADIPTFIVFNGRSMTDKLVRPDFKQIEKLVWQVSGFDKESHDRAPMSPLPEEKALPPAGDDYRAGEAHEADDRREENPEAEGDH